MKTMNDVVAIYPGSFDPLTNGHVDIIQRGSRFFDRIVIGILLNLEKSPLFTVPVGGGIEEALPIPNAARATYSPDGQRIAYNPIAGRYQQWKQYRGGTVSRLWLYDRKSHAIDKVPQPETRSNDTDPMWIGDTVYFRSDRNGEFNVFGLSRPERIERCQPHRLRTGGRAARARPAVGGQQEAVDWRGLRPARAAAAVREGCALDP